MASTFFGTGADEQVPCIACGETVDEGESFEYDKYGDPWSREGKRFESICKPCYRDYCHQNRDGLEATLIAADAGRTDRRTFLRQFCERMADEAEPNRKQS